MVTQKLTDGFSWIARNRGMVIAQRFWGDAARIWHFSSGGMPERLSDFSISV